MLLVSLEKALKNIVLIEELVLRGKQRSSKDEEKKRYSNKEEIKNSIIKGSITKDSIGVYFA